MRAALVLLAVVMIILAALFYQAEQASRQESAAHMQALRSAQSQLATTVEQAESVQTHMAAVQTQLLAQVAELQGSLAKVTAEKANDEQATHDLQGRLETVEKGLADEKAREITVEDERQSIAGKLGVVTSQLDITRQQYADLEKTHHATVAELEAMKGRVTALEQERDSLVRQFNDLDALQAQIKVVKHRLWEEHVADWKTRDEAAANGGNAGLLMKSGQWQTTAPKPAD